MVDQFIHKLENKTQRFMTNQEVKQKANLNVPDELKALNLQLHLKYSKVISVSKTDLGRCTKFKHRLHLKDDLSVYQKQFPLKPDHQEFVEQSLRECPRNPDKACKSAKTSVASTPRHRWTNTP